MNCIIQQVPSLGHRTIQKQKNYWKVNYSHILTEESENG